MLRSRTNACHVGLLLAVLSACGTNAQSEACKIYVACSTVLEQPDLASLDSTFGAMGSCWTPDRPTAASCTSACQAGVETLRAAHPNQAKCR